MSLSSELSSEVAAAILAEGRRRSQELHKLKEVVLAIHSTLQQMTNDGRPSEEEAVATADPQSPSHQAEF